MPLGPNGGQPFGYAGEQWDANTNLIYLRARWYNPYLSLAQHSPWPPPTTNAATCAATARFHGSQPRPHARRAAGDRIPSIRELAESIEVNPNTVVRTYAYLQDQGIIQNQPCGKATI